MKRRFWIGIAAVVAIALGSVIAAIGVYENDENDFNRVQSDDAARAAHQAEAVAALSVGKLSTAAAIVQTQGEVSRHEFRVIGRSLLGDGALDGAAYVPRVPASRRAAFEDTVGVEITERALGPLLPVVARPSLLGRLSYARHGNRLMDHRDVKLGRVDPGDQRADIIVIPVFRDVHRRENP